MYESCFVKYCSCKLPQVVKHICTAGMLMQVILHDCLSMLDCVKPSLGQCALATTMHSMLRLCLTLLFMLKACQMSDDAVCQGLMQLPDNNHRRCSQSVTKACKWYCQPARHWMQWCKLQVPQSEAKLTHAKRASMTAAAVVIQRWWRHLMWTKSAQRRKQDRYWLVVLTS